ncbi:hypothetical protein PYCCODRAFT_1455431 [Trametes coccinea BRFM310]|uniref:Uncharacterized protein n=1 Tax=Trametes coccinea (strain BRFM310) TaxID=1353009 RepID=A0A1Y2J4E6_TRAC3|nr:hypothetical protein PYCCODRAFT_1455431 [Trametes coccinea BRFM310]
MGRCLYSTTIRMEYTLTPHLYVDQDTRVSTDQPDAIHDMESFWLLLNVCITSSGPGGERRKELPDELTGEIDAQQISDVCDVVYRPFEGPFGTIARNTKTLFELPQQFEWTIPCHVHPYYDPLKPLLRRRWQLLILAYIYRGYMYCNIHKFVIQLLEDALRDLEDRGPPGDAQQVRDARKKREDFVREAVLATMRVDVHTSQAKAVLRSAESGELGMEPAASKHPQTSQKEKRDAPSPPSSQMHPMDRSRT